MTLQPQLPVSGDGDPGDATPYVHREPSALRKALPWIVTAAVVLGLIWLGTALVKSLEGRSRGFVILFIDGGWKKFLLFLLAASGVLALTSLIGQRLGQVRTGRRIRYMEVLGDQLTHLFLILVVLIAVYPLFYMVVAAFNPVNSLFLSPDPQSSNFLYRAGLLPKLDALSYENFQKLFAGVVVPGWQVLAATLIGAGLALLGSIALLKKYGRENESMERVNTWAGRLVVALLAILVVFITPAQFTGGDNNSKFLLSVRNTLLVSGATGLLGILLSTTAGYAIARLRFPGRFQTLLFFIFIQMFPVVLALVAIYGLMVQLGLSNSLIGLVLAYSGGAIAFNTWIYKGYVESLPISLEEAAMVDGATRWQTFLRVILPLSGGILVFIFLNQFIGTYAEYILSSVLLTGVDKWTVGLMLISFTSDRSVSWGIFAAAATLGALPIVLLFYSFQRFFVGGTVSGGVKE